MRTILLGILLSALFLICARTTIASESENDAPQTTSTSESSPLSRAYWCRARNGTYVPFGYSYMQTACTMCQCTSSRAIRCAMLQCLPTYCIDNAVPVRKPGQCCTQCPSDEVLGTTSTCVYNGATYPHGAIMKTVENKMLCWCQLGSIECRNSVASLYQSMSIFSDNTAIYIVVVIVLIILIVGVLLCCSCTLFYYYFYQRYQQTVQQQYDEYVNSAGWQPMEEEQTPADATAEEKRLEAEKYQAFNGVSEGVPPPYGSFQNAFSAEGEQKKL